MCEHDHKSKHSCCCGDGHGHDCEESFLHSWGIELTTSVLYLAALILSWTDSYPSEFWRATAYIVAMIPAAWFVVRKGWPLWRKLDFLNEFTLMLAAAVGAAILGEYPEAVAVLLFYCIGEKLEDVVNDDVRRRVRSLLGNLPDKAVVIGADGSREEVGPRDVKVGETIAVAPGERAPLDGVLLGDKETDFDTAAITGESVPRSFAPGEEIASGMIPADREVLLKVTKPFSDSTMSRILAMVENAASQKSPAESMLRRISRWYTPAVFVLALCVVFVPWIVSLFPGAAPWEGLVWFRRSLIFLVCSCPCALIVSIPLSYFMAIGLAAKRGLLFKGSKYMDLMRRVDTVFLDKTGTVTAGVFTVTDIEPQPGFETGEVLGIAAALDASLTHPLAKAIVKYHTDNSDNSESSDFSDLSDITVVNHGVKGVLTDSAPTAGRGRPITGRPITGRVITGRVIAVCGSAKLMTDEGIGLPDVAIPAGKTAVYVALDGKLMGRILLQDTPKADSKTAIAEMHALGIDDVEILSGDTPEAVSPVAAAVGADGFKGSLLPADKQHIITETVREGHIVAFAGDGINDAPALAAANVGIAMGTAGTGIAMQSADVILVGDDLMKIPQARKLSKRVARVVAENVGFAFGVKGIVMILGACGVATLWAAVFADTGVTLCAVLWTILRLGIRSKDK